MNAQSPETEIALLQQRTNDITATLSEIKSDVKDIKTFIAALDNHYITRGEFDAFKKQYWLTHSMTAILTALATAAAYWVISGLVGK